MNIRCAMPPPLAKLDPSHPYRALATGAYRPLVVEDDAAWELARVAATVIVAEDVVGLNNGRFGATRRSYISSLCYALAVEDPDLLDPAIVLSEDEIIRFAAQHGERNGACQGSRNAVAGALRSMRAGFPDLFPTPNPDLGGIVSDANPPTSASEFKAAMNATHALRIPGEHDVVRCVLLSVRGAGLGSTALSHMYGSDVERRPSGVWAVVRAPGQEREVPVLGRYAGPLLARAQRRPNALLTGAATAGDTKRVTALLGRINDIMGRDLGAGRVTAERLRKAWLLEHAHNSDTYTPWLMQIAGIGSTSSLHALLQAHPPPTASDHELAKKFGAMS